VRMHQERTAASILIMFCTWFEHRLAWQSVDEYLADAFHLQSSHNLATFIGTRSA